MTIRTRIEPKIKEDQISAEFRQLTGSPVAENHAALNLISDALAEVVLPAGCLAVALRLVERGCLLPWPRSEHRP